MTKKKISDTFGKKIVLEELRRNFDNSYSSIDILDNKLQSILGISSIVIALISFIDFDSLSNNFGDYFNCWFFILISIYLSIIYIFFKAIKPRNYPHPISNNWEELLERQFSQDESTVLDNTNYDYLRFIKEINSIAKEKAKSLNLMLKLFSGLVLIIIITIYYSVK